MTSVGSASADLTTPRVSDRLAVMQRTSSRSWPDRASFWHIGGLAWQAASICRPDAAVAVVGPSNAPEAWGWIDEGSHLNALVAADDSGSAQALVGWFASQASSTQDLTVTVPSGSQALTEALTALGFGRVVHAAFTVDMRRETGLALGAPTPSGYRARTLQDGEQA